MLNNIKEKVLENMIERRAKPYLSTLHDYLAYIKQGVSKGEVRAEHLFNILRDIGYLEMVGAQPPAKSLQYIQKILRSEGPFTGESTPDLIDFEDLSYEMESYIAQARAPKPPPLLNEIIREEAWEDMWREEKERGRGLISAALDMVAVELGHVRVLNEDPGSPAWNNVWNDFENKAKQYMEKLSANKKSFYRFSDDVFSFLTEFRTMPECSFHKVLVEIAATRESYVEESNYRRILSPEEANEIYFRTNMKFEKYSPMARFHFYENALAQEILKAFVTRICLAKEENNHKGTWNQRLLTTLDDDFDSTVPMISAGGKTYSVHMLYTPTSKISGWGMRKDRMQPFLSDAEFRGALFCSWKIYPTDEVLVRFDNYIERNRLNELLSHKKPFFRKNFFRDYVMMTLDDVYKYPLRDKFLKEAASAAMELPLEKREQVPALGIEERERLNTALVLANMVSLRVIMRIAAMYSYHLKARRPVRSMGATSPPPESNIIFVPVTFPAEGAKNKDFFDPFSGVEDLSRLIDLAGQEEWHLITFFAHSEKEIKLDIKEDPEQFMSGGRISKDVPAGTKVVGFVVGPKDKVKKVRDTFDQPGEVSDVELKDIYWVFYGPGKEEEDSD